MHDLIESLGGTPGVYRLHSRISADDLRDELAEAGLRCAVLNGNAIEDKRSFLQACAAALDVPGYFGHNWDAFEEVIGDGSWSPGPPDVLLYDDVARFAMADRESWHVALDILRTATDAWREQGRPFWVLLRGTRGTVPEIPVLQLG